MTEELSTLEATYPGDAIAVALDYAETHALADTVDLSHDRVLVRRRAGETWDVQSTDDPHPPRPRRAVGTLDVHDAESFDLALGQRGGLSAPIYANEETMSLVAVLNDDDEMPGWRDHRVSLALRRTPEWADWCNGQGLGAQQRFAERIEDGEPEIVQPAAADMLTIAQTFYASVGVNFRSANRLANGETQFAYEEDVKASAGSKPGTIAIPETFRIRVRPFIGSDAYEVTARLRYRLKGGELSIGYTLVRPDEVERDAFRQAVAEVTNRLADATILRGPAPAVAAS